MHKSTAHMHELDIIIVVQFIDISLDFATVTGW